MKTTLPSEIKSLEEAKAFLTELCENGEDYHPDDNAHDVRWSCEQPPTIGECNQLNHLMTNILTRFSKELDPYSFIMEFGNPAPLIDIDKNYTNIKSVFSENTGGNVYNDVITLKCGVIIRISDGMIQAFRDKASDEASYPIDEILLP